ncbi:MAG: hypothetical protein QGF46_06300, partial [Planctomycetota bacterium]|nr:hypothetical protein [Planctomycetota bacterium]
NLISKKGEHSRKILLDEIMNIDPELIILMPCGFDIERTMREYKKILQREAPQLVVGDVLSLDLSQPLAMRVDGDDAAPTAVGVMHLPHTPEWVLESIGPAPHEIDYLVPHVTSIPRVVERVRESCLTYGLKS